MKRMLIVLLLFNLFIIPKVSAVKIDYSNVYSVPYMAFDYGYNYADADEFGNITRWVEDTIKLNDTNDETGIFRFSGKKADPFNVTAHCDYFVFNISSGTYKNFIYRIGQDAYSFCSGWFFNSGNGLSWTLLLNWNGGTRNIPTNLTVTNNTSYARYCYYATAGSCWAQVYGATWGSPEVDIEWEEEVISSKKIRITIDNKKSYHLHNITVETDYPIESVIVDGMDWQYFDRFHIYNITLSRTVIEYTLTDPIFFFLFPTLRLLFPFFVIFTVLAILHFFGNKLLGIEFPKYGKRFTLEANIYLGFFILGLLITMFIVLVMLGMVIQAF